MSQHQVIVSLGSNQGNRFETIQACIDLIHSEVATIVKVSRFTKRQLGVLKVNLL